ncbi:MAG: FAD-binding oxidoreductase [Chitinophagaceae bacterium]|nr:MAG: FAD-binding oxidoreductase [Chitinophagaceae bacterium]
MTHIDFLLIGQGVCGTFLSKYLMEAGYSVVIIDEEKKNTASRVASGVINPVTGRRIVKTWLIDEVMPFAKHAYDELGKSLGINALREISVLDFFPTPQITEAFKKRFAEDTQFLSMPADPNMWIDYINYEFGYGEITPAYLVNLTDIINRSREKLADTGILRSEKFDFSALKLNEASATYNDLDASRIIFCDGIAGGENPFFRLLPFGANKGEAVLVEIDELPPDHIYKKGFNLVPWKDNVFWLGSNYLWEFEDDTPTPGFYRFAENWLKQTVRVPFRIVDHLAGIRPATLERRPFVGFHPIYENVGIFNGMGTKGCSLAPFFARQFTEQIRNGGGLYPEADVKRFTKVLSR